MLHLMAFFLIFLLSFCQLDTCKCVVLFFMYICKCFLMPFMYVLFVKILSYVEEIKNIYLSIYLPFSNAKEYRCQGEIHIHCCYKHVNESSFQVIWILA